MQISDVDNIETLPGAELVLAGMRDLHNGDISDNALLVLIAKPRLERLGFEVPDVRISRALSHELYSRLEVSKGNSAYSYFNSLLRRLNSFASILEKSV